MQFVIYDPHGNRHRSASGLLDKMGVRAQVEKVNDALAIVQKVLGMEVMIE